MRIFFEPDDAKYVVFRMKEGMRREDMPEKLEGVWRERDPYFMQASAYNIVPAPDWAVRPLASPTNHFEVRSDGMIAQVWEVSW